MSKPFKLSSWRKTNIAAGTKKRLAMPMRSFGRQVEWLYEAPISCPELSLGVAVLQRAVLDLITPGVSEKDRKDALMWLNGEYGLEFEASYSMSFTRIVESFSGIEVDEFRERILDFVNGANQEAADIFRFQRA
jgi:hypothetical protein